jgi:hypothetical protein
VAVHALLASRAARAPPLPACSLAPTETDGDGPAPAAATQELKSIISSTHAAAPKSSEESDFDESEDEALVGPTAAGSAAARPTRVAASKKAPDRAAVSVGGGRKK